MSITRKIEEICAMKLEAGKTISTAWGWNGSTIQSLGANDGLPYIAKSIKINVLNAEDDSVEGAAFQDLPNQVGLEAPVDNLEGNVRYDGLDHLWYWMFGYEDGGTSPVNLGGGYYEHLFELDAHERHFTTYRTAEQTAGDYASTDRKNRAATFAFKKGTNDFRYPHVMCNGFSFRSSAERGIVTWSAKGIAPKETRADYSSSTWTIPTALQGSANNVLHRHTTVSIKAQAGAYTALNVSSWELNVDIPLKMDRDTESGLYLIEPVFEGKYNIDFSLILSRHDTETYMDYRDDWSGNPLSVKIVAASGSYTWELYLPEMRIPDAALSEDDVPQHPLTFRTGPVDADTANIFATEIADSVLIQNGNLFLITNNTNSTNEMRRR